MAFFPEKGCVRGGRLTSHDYVIDADHRKQYL